MNIFDFKNTGLENIGLENKGLKNKDLIIQDLRIWDLRIQNLMIINEGSSLTIVGKGSFLTLLKRLIEYAYEYVYGETFIADRNHWFGVDYYLLVSMERH